MLHRPAEHAEEHQREQIAPVPRRLERADIDEAEHARHEQRVAQRRDLRELAAEREAQAGAEDVGDGDAPHHRIGDVEMFGEHFRPGHEAVNEEGAEQDRHAGARRHAERDGRHQRAAFARIGGAFGGDDAAHVAGAEGLRRALFGAQRVAVGNPVDHRGADAGNGAHRRADPRAAQNQEPVVQAILDAEQHAGLGVERHAFLHDRHAPDGEVAQFRQRENAERQRHQRQAVPQIQACPWSSAACPIAGRCRSSTASCRSTRRSARAAAHCPTAPPPWKCRTRQCRAVRASRYRE